MIGKELREDSQEPLDVEGSDFYKALYEAARKLTAKEKVHLIRRIIDSSEMSLSLRVEITGSSKITILNFDLDDYEKAIQNKEAPAPGLDKDQNSTVVPDD